MYKLVALLSCIFLSLINLSAQGTNTDHVPLDDWPWTREARAFFGPFDDGTSVMLSSVGYVGGTRGGRNWELQHVEAGLKLGRKKEILDGAAVDEDRFQGMVEWNGQLLMVVEKRYHKGQRSTFYLHRYDPSDLSAIGRPERMLDLQQRADYDDSKILIEKSPNGSLLLFATIVPAGSGKARKNNTAVFIVVNESGEVLESKSMDLPEDIEVFKATQFAISDAGLVYSVGIRKRGLASEGMGLLACEPGDEKWRKLDDGLPKEGVHHAGITLHKGSDDISVVGIMGLYEKADDVEEDDPFDSLHQITVYRLDALDGNILMDKVHTISSLGLPKQQKLKGNGTVKNTYPFTLSRYAAYIDMVEALEDGGLLLGINRSHLRDDYLSMRIDPDGQIRWMNLLDRSVFFREGDATINVMTENILPHFDGETLHLVFNDTPERSNVSMDEPTPQFTFLDRNLSAFHRSISVEDGQAEQQLMFTRDSYGKALMRSDAMYADKERVLVFVAKLQGVSLNQALVEMEF